VQITLVNSDERFVERLRLHQTATGPQLAHHSIPHVTLWTDGGGKVRQAMRPVVGSDKVAAWFAGISRQPYQGVDFADMNVEVLEINGDAGLVFTGAGRVLATVTVELDPDARIVAIHNVANPDKLRAITDGRRLEILGG
jgi:RNA polymerase sigma-70 factor (ECF subfamily)